MNITVNTIAAQTGVGFKLSKGQRLEVVDPEGSQVSDLYCFNAEDIGESFSAGRSIDYADSIYLTTGSELYSNRSRVMLSIIDDTCGRHDALMTPCSGEMFRIVSGDPDLKHPGCLENLAHGLKKFDISSDRIGTTFNIFMNVTVDTKGRLKIERPRSKAGDRVVFEAKMDLIVALTACSHEETNGGVCKPIRYRILES
ncbi:MAG: urea carboxylase-associated family protein [Bdellovibrionota bacterium]